MRKDLQEILWSYADKYRVVDFLEDDPLQIPHRFSRKEDIEISGFFSAIMAWGQRKSIIKSSTELIRRMDNAPHDFILNFSTSDLTTFKGFVHRTLNSDDVIYILNRFQSLYKQGKSLESAFQISNIEVIKDPSVIHDKNNLNQELDKNSTIFYRENRVKNSLANFYDWMFIDGENRTKKHISDPRKKSACKRLNMFLRWMVRENDGLDFGIWHTISPSELMMPLDVHVLRMTEMLGIVEDLKGNWDGCEHLTSIFREINPEDPTLFDFALFGLGVDYRRQLI
jgi:uncharacterized protein (TIGR02757 family)